EQPPALLSSAHSPPRAAGDRRGGRSFTQRPSVGKNRVEPDPFDRAVRFYEQGDLRGALSLFRHAAKRDDSDPAAHAWIGFVLLRLGQPAAAVAPLRRATAL